MTAEQALEIVTNAIQTEHMTVEQDKALAITQKALEKQIPKKPNLSGDSCDKDGNLIYDTYDCPSCHTSYEMEYEKYDHCPSCGQALDWSEEVSENEQNQN